MEKVEFLSVLVVCFVFALGALSSYLDKRAVEMGRTDFNRAARLRAGALEEQMSETKLRPCPFCGKYPVIETIQGYRAIVCPSSKNCVRPACTRQTEEWAADVWNTRSLENELVDALKAQHGAMDRLLAMVIALDSTFMPTKSGKIWEAMLQGNAAIAHAEGRK